MHNLHLPRLRRPRRSPLTWQAADTSSPHQIQLDDKHRVITAGGFVKTGPMVFEDISEKAGLEKVDLQDGHAGQGLHHRDQGLRRRTIDYDNDGWLDIYLVNGSTVDALSGKEPPRRQRYFTTITTAHSPTSPPKRA